jgi:hypothetical protein
MNKKGCLSSLLALAFLITAIVAWLWWAREGFMARNQELVEYMDQIITTSTSLSEARNRLKEEKFPDKVWYVGIKKNGSDTYDEVHKNFDGERFNKSMILDFGYLIFATGTGDIKLAAIFKHARKSRNGDLVDYAIGIDRSMIGK